MCQNKVFSAYEKGVFFSIFDFFLKLPHFVGLLHLEMWSIMCYGAGEKQVQLSRDLENSLRVGIRGP